MKDLYKRLNLPGDATEAQISASLHAAPADLQGSAEMILLDPRRRRVYDRNRQLLITIGQLRFDLGLNYTRFWSRRQFKDFWKVPNFAPATPSQDQAPKRRVDPIMIARAFHTARHHGRHHAARWGPWWTLALIALAASALIYALWHASF